ncbi:MFS transporter [Megasphaera cerevisiae DSM 20462]|uniref:MFS transporter n=1 Tax=Megasphaera cerevisiae DSM 20462 TaxID=1122219 RepID=A0A0J6WXJ7_9FIRM|nr:MFS transporter [Megasphaera cerevisiae]KMO86547.1 MFS transporter [Megasphaera cerevisiae DSM 20462]OKY53763.1 MFS transporter [Megasphaera cerevisiae]SJZ90133.1 Predicted arabinose efflux permease, MFS family [Megasphaera cerevisiae DSM 20462]
MNKPELWTNHFFAIITANGLLFASFHCLLPTLPLYIASLGASGTEIGLIAGIFGISAIFIRFFTNDLVTLLGKKKCLYIGIFLSLIATISYAFFTSIQMLMTARIVQGLGFGLGTTFAAALAIDIIPASRRGEGVGYFGLGNTISMGIAPAFGVILLTGFSAGFLFAFSAAAAALAIISTRFCGTTAADKPHSISPQLHKSIPFRSRFFETGTGFPSFFTMLFGIAYGSVNTFIALMAQEAHIGNAGLFFVTGTIFIFLSRTFGGRLYDAKGPFWVMLPGIVSYTLALGLIILSASLTSLLIASVFYGLGAGLIMPALMTWLFSSVPAERRSSASATYYNMLDVGTSGGIIIFGSVAGLTGYIHMYDYVLAIMFLFLAVFLFQHFFKPADPRRSVCSGKE